MGGHKPFQEITSRVGDLFYFEPERLVLRKDARSAEALDESLVANIMKNGVIKPVVIAKEGDLPVVDDGNRRVRHAIAANARLREAGAERLVLVPCVYRRGDDAMRLAVRISANNFSRPDEVLEKARLVAHALALGGTEEACAIDFGVDVQTIKGWLKLLEAAPEVAKAVADGHISASAAAELTALPREAQKKTLSEMETAGGKVTAKRARRAARGESKKPDKRIRSRAEIERVLTYNAIILKGLDGFKVLYWVLGWEEIPELGAEKP